MAAAALYGVTGDGASTPETLFTLNQTDATPTFVQTLGNGDDGEVIVFHPDNGLFYHWSGRGTANVDAIFESIDPTTGTVTGINYVGFHGSSTTFAEEALGATYNPGTGGFLVADLDEFLYSQTLGGTVSQIGAMDHESKGLAFVGSTLYSVAQDDDQLRVIDPATAATLSQVTITVPGFDVIGANGLATPPDTNDLWVLLNGARRSPTRQLATIDPTTGVATFIGDTGDRFAGIAFRYFCPDDVLISNYQTTPPQFVEVANVGTGPIGLAGCSLVTFNVFTQRSIGTATKGLSGVLNSGDTQQVSIAGAPAGPGATGLYDVSPAPPNGTPFSTANEITGMVYLNNATVFGISHLTVPAHNAIYACIYGGSGQGPFARPFQPVSSCVP